MRYGAILGKHQEISRAELRAQGIHIEKHYGPVAIFSFGEEGKDMSKRLQQMISHIAGIVKRGEVQQTAMLTDSDIIGVSERELGTFLKKKGICKRYKEIGPLHTDKEIKEKGQEYVVLDDQYTQVLHITGYQDIDRFAIIDFEKPVNSMHIGMMPAKLTQIMINIAAGKAAKTQAIFSDGTEDISPKDLTIYDPFMGLGTTYMVANSMGYPVIGSDINITPAKQNLPRWKKQQQAHDLPITLFAHDATQSLQKPFLTYVRAIVTEGRLGHIITAKTKEGDIAAYSQEIEKLYKAWINNMYPLRKHMTIVCAVPEYTRGTNEHIEKIQSHCIAKNMTVTVVSQTYRRVGQQVGRKIFIIQW